MITSKGGGVHYYLWAVIWKGLWKDFIICGPYLEGAWKWGVASFVGHDHDDVKGSLTLNVRGLSYLGLTRSISWLLKPWLLASPGHQQPWYWPCRMGKSLSYLRKGFNHLCHISVEEWHKMYTVETLYSTIYYDKYFIKLNIDKSTQNVALWTHKRHPIPRPFGRAMECLLWVLQQKSIML